MNFLSFKVSTQFLKAFFKIGRCFEHHKPKIKAILHVFDHTVKPVWSNTCKIALILGLWCSKHKIKIKQYFCKWDRLFCKPAGVSDNNITLSA
jgi:hypothetical protein